MPLSSGLAGTGQEIATRPFQLVTDRVWKGTVFSAARDRTDIPMIVDWYIEGKINIEHLITHTMPLDKINGAFGLANWSYRPMTASRSNSWTSSPHTPQQQSGRSGVVGSTPTAPTNIPARP